MNTDNTIITDNTVDITALATRRGARGAHYPAYLWGKPTSKYRARYRVERRTDRYPTAA